MQALGASAHYKPIVLTYWKRFLVKSSHLHTDALHVKISEAPLLNQEVNRAGDELFHL